MIDPAHAESASLDDWYAHVNQIYLDRNFYKTDSMVFMHLSEIVGGLSILASNKVKPDVTAAEYVPKAIAWWLALCGKVGVKSVSDMVWWKYPGVCTYCRQDRHDDLACQKAKERDGGPDWEKLKAIAKQNEAQRPRTLDEWMEMFQHIYPANRSSDFGPTFARFSEEMGELAESLRIFPISPGSYLSEGADVFAWLMHLQNLLRVHSRADERGLGAGMSEAYARGCKDCTNPVCTCPPILPTTLHRIAHEAPSFRKSFTASMMPLDEAMAKFSMTTRQIVVGGREIEATPDLLTEINNGVTQLILLALSNKESSATQTKILLDSLYQVSDLTAAHRVTTQSLESLAQAIASLEPEPKQHLIDFLQGVTEGVWAGLLLDLVKAAVAG